MPADQPRTAEETLGRIARAQALLAEVSRNLGPTLALESTLKSVLSAMRDLVDFRGGSIALAEGGQIRIAAADPPVSDEVLALRLPVGQGIVGTVVQDARTVYSPDIGADRRVDPDVRRTGSNSTIVSYLAVPLICLGNPIGVLQVDNEAEDAFDEIDIMLLEGLAAQTATAIESARQFEERTRLDNIKHGFINMVSHELRTPLTIAGGMVGAVRMDDTLSADSRSLLDRADVAIDRLGRLIEELIMMSQLSAGAIRPKRRDVDAHEMVRGVVGRLADPTLVDVSAVPPATVSIDDRLLQIVLGALVENAVTYAGSGEIHFDGASTWLVVDHGPGLPDDVLIDGMETFSRSSTNATTVAGLGLGLSMATALTAELGGELTLDTTPGTGGTTIRIVLPD